MIHQAPIELIPFSLPFHARHTPFTLVFGPTQIWDTGECVFFSLYCIRMLLALALINFWLRFFFLLGTCVCSQQIAGQEKFRSITHAYYRDAHGKFDCFFFSFIVIKLFEQDE